MKERQEEKKYILLALDLDGTMLNDEGKLTEETLQTLWYAKKQHCIVCFVTGRRKIDMEPIREQCRIADYLLLDNGAELIDLNRDETIFHKRPDRDAVIKIVNWCLERDFLLYVIAGRFLAVNRITEGVKRYTAYLGVEPYVFRSCGELPVERVDGLMVTDEGAGISEFLKREGLPLYCRQSEPNSIDLIVEGAGKWQGVKFLAERLQLSSQAIIAVGNYTNDIEMIENAGIGVAVANALDEVKEAADYVTERDNNHNPLLEVYEQLIIKSK